MSGARIAVDELAWERITVDGRGHDHAWVRKGQEVRTTVVTVDGTGDEQQPGRVGAEGPHPAEVDRLGVPRLPQGRVHDLPETARPRDGHLPGGALALRHGSTSTGARRTTTCGRSCCGRSRRCTPSPCSRRCGRWVRRCSTAHPEIAEIRFSAPNKHHFLVDLEPFGLDNPGEVFFAADRPYGLIECSVGRDDAPDAGLAWYTVPGFI